MLQAKKKRKKKRSVFFPSNSFFLFYICFLLPKKTQNRSHRAYGGASANSSRVFNGFAGSGEFTRYNYTGVSDKFAEVEFHSRTFRQNYKRPFDPESRAGRVLQN